MNAIRPARTVPALAAASVAPARPPAPPGGPTPWPAAGLGAVAGLALLADLLQPAFPALGLLALVSAAGFGVAVVRPAAWARPAAWLAVGLGGLALMQTAAGQPRGVLAANLPELAMLQDRLLHRVPPPWDADRLRAALVQPGSKPRPAAASADEALFNALLLHARQDAAGAGAALAEALRLDPAPRPDAVLLAARIMRGQPQEIVPPLARTLALAEPAARVAALEPLWAAEPDDLLAAAALAQARIEASLPLGPTIAEAGRIAAALRAFDDPEAVAAFVTSFLDRRQAEALLQGLAALDWVREVAERRLEVSEALPPPGMPDQPALLRLAAPEPATAVQLRHGDAWVTVEQGPEDPVPTLRMPRPFRPATLRLRHVDRDGIASAETIHRFDPAAALRAQAQRALARQGPFALYQPGWLEPGRLNPLPIPGHLRAGLSTIEWRSDAEPDPRRSPVGVTDATLLAGDPARILVEFAVPETARLLVLRAILADGTEAEWTEMAIR
jgi:hypothetical protein